MGKNFNERLDRGQLLGADGGDGSSAITNSFLNNFTGNFVWIRIEVTAFTAGTINNIFMAH